MYWIDYFLICLDFQMKSCKGGFFSGAFIALNSLSGAAELKNLRSPAVKSQIDTLFQDMILVCFFLMFTQNLNAIDDCDSLA